MTYAFHPGRPAVGQSARSGAAALRAATTAALTAALLITATWANAGTTASSSQPDDTVGAETTTASGLKFKLMKAGSGPRPKASDVVRVHYRGTLMDGTEFDSSFKRGQPAEFPLNQVIRCWTEGVQRMQVGATAQLVCPPAIAYGSRAVGGVIPANSTLKFEVELLGIAGSR